MTRGVEGLDRKQPRLSNSAHDHLQRAGCSGHLTISHPYLQGAQERGRIEQDAASARRSLEERLAAVETEWENERREWEREKEELERLRLETARDRELQAERAKRDREELEELRREVLEAAAGITTSAAREVKVVVASPLAVVKTETPVEARALSRLLLGSAQTRVAGLLTQHSLRRGPDSASQTGTPEARRPPSEWR